MVYKECCNVIVLLVVVGVVALFVILVIAQNSKLLYTRTNCSICGEPTGFKGNKRFMLSDGYMCQPCAAKSVQTLAGVGPSAFATKTTNSVKSSIKRRQEVGDEKWLAELSEQQFAEEEAKMTQAREKIKGINASAQNEGNIPRCPKCRSTSISADKKGFGVGKAVVGAAIAGPLGLAGGNIGAKKVRITCLNCGHQWMAGKG
jgi:transposase-like protein